MNSRPILILAGLAASLVLGTAASGQQFLTVPLNSAWVNDVSPDGRVVVGDWFGGAFYWRWQEDPAPVDIGGTSARGVSDDGTVIGGSMVDPVTGKQIAGRWTAATGWVSLGGFSTCDLTTSTGYDISADGTQVVGLAWDGCNGRGFLWTEGVGIQLLDELGNGVNRASAISGDGSVIGGFAQGDFDRTPALWSPSLTGQVYDMSYLGEIHGFNEDGSILLGTIGGSAFFQTAAGSTFIGQLSPSWQGIPQDVTQDGATIVGFDVFGSALRAWMWTESGGMTRLDDLATSLGLSGLPSLYACRAVSEDGNVIVGGCAGGPPFGLGGFILTLTDVLGTWTDVGNGLAGAQGTPSLAGDGTLIGDTNTVLELSGGVPSGTATLVLGVSPINAPFKLGVLVPSPDIVLAGLPLDASGSLTFQFAWPVGLPSQASLYWQYWIPDPSGPAGYSASNGLQVTTP